MATSIDLIHNLIKWYLMTEPATRLHYLMISSPRKEDTGERDRAALRRILKQLQNIETSRNTLLEEFASDNWEVRQLDLFESEKPAQPLFD